MIYILLLSIGSLMYKHSFCHSFIEFSQIINITSICHVFLVFIIYYGFLTLVCFHDIQIFFNDQLVVFFFSSVECVLVVP